VTCWRRLRDWQEAGVRDRLHQKLFEHLAQAEKLDRSRAALDSRSLAAKKGALQRPKPDRQGQSGLRRHILVERGGIPLAVDLTAANLNDHLLLGWMRDLVPRVCNGKPGRSRRRQRKLHADRGYDFRVCRQTLRVRGILARIARRGIERTDRLGRRRWVVERTFAWLMQFRRLATRYERRADSHLAFMTLGCALICHRSLGAG
jgi:transposase